MKWADRGKKSKHQEIEKTLAEWVQEVNKTAM